MKASRSSVGPVLPVLLAGVCAVLGWKVYHEAALYVGPPAEIVTAVAVPEPLEPLPAPGAFELAPIEEFQEVVERPLFSQSRRPAMPDEEAPGAPLPAQLNLTLAGIVGAGEARVAIMTTRKGRETISLAPGDSYQGWTVAEVSSRAIVFRQGDRRVEIVLDYELVPKRHGGQSQGAVKPGKAEQGD